VSPTGRAGGKHILVILQTNSGRVGAETILASHRLLALDNACHRAEQRVIYFYNTIP
jgi:hypothetical protein